MFAASSRILRSVSFVSALAVLFLVGSAHHLNGQTTPAVQGQEGNVKFLWAFGALVQEGNDRKLEPITRDRALKTGDRFKMLVEPLDRCFVYVIYHNSQDEMALLFPYSLDQFGADYGASRKYFIPQGDGWFELDEHVGLEAFYLLASDQRLSDLESLLDQYGSADTATKPEMAKQVLAEVRRIKKERKELAAPAERPVNLGGVIRGIEKPQAANQPDITSLAREISASGFYGKTFTIDHQ